MQQTTRSTHRNGLFLECGSKRIGIEGHERNDIAPTEGETSATDASNTPGTSCCRNGRSVPQFFECGDDGLPPQIAATRQLSAEETLRIDRRSKASVPLDWAWNVPWSIGHIG